MINPLEELVGNPEPLAVEPDENGDDVILPPIPGMKLGIRDVPVIAPFLCDDHLILGVEYWREFHPSRTTIGTRELFRGLLRSAAKRELADEREWEELDEAEISKRIDGIIAWAEERADQSEVELMLEVLGDLWDGSEAWHKASGVATELAELGNQEALPLIARWLKYPDTEEYEVERIPALLEQIDVARA